MSGDHKTKSGGTVRNFNPADLPYEAKLVPAMMDVLTLALAPYEHHPLVLLLCCHKPDGTKTIRAVTEVVFKPGDEASRNACQELWQRVREFADDALAMLDNKQADMFAAPEPTGKPV